MQDAYCGKMRGSDSLPQSCRLRRENLLSGGFPSSSADSRPCSSFTRGTRFFDGWEGAKLTRLTYATGPELRSRNGGGVRLCRVRTATGRPGGCWPRGASPARRTGRRPDATNLVYLLNNFAFEAGRSGTESAGFIGPSGQRNQSSGGTAPVACASKRAGVAVGRTGSAEQSPPSKASGKGQGGGR